MSETNGHKPIIVTEYLPYHFTEEETRDLAKLLARQTQDLEQLRLRKKQVNKDLDSQIADSEARISAVARQLNNGYEYRDIKCEVKLNDPEDGRKSFYRTDNGEVGKVMGMSAEDFQASLKFEGEAGDNLTAPSV